MVPIVTRDSGSPPQSAIRYLKIVIGDKNDNPMFDGTSTIHVYNYKGAATCFCDLETLSIDVSTFLMLGQLPSTTIGRVFVDDLDDWDVVDKDFKLQKSSNYFEVANDGLITMNKETPVGTYKLEVETSRN